MEHMSQVRLQAIAEVTEQLSLPSGRSIPTMHWSTDEESGRPVCRWVLVEARPACLP
jgi:hypothetical protein